MRDWADERCASLPRRAEMSPQQPQINVALTTIHRSQMKNQKNDNAMEVVVTIFAHGGFTPM